MRLSLAAEEKWPSYAQAKQMFQRLWAKHYLIPLDAEDLVSNPEKRGRLCFPKFSITHCYYHFSFRLMRPYRKDSKTGEVRMERGEQKEAWLLCSKQQAKNRAIGIRPGIFAQAYYWHIFLQSRHLLPGQKKRWYQSL